MPTLRAVLDTKLLLSRKRVAAWRHGALEVAFSEYIFDELRRVLPKLAHRHVLGANEIEDLIDALAIQVEIVEPVAIDELDLADANDLPVLGTLVTAQREEQTTVLISGDKVLLALSDRYPIRTPAEFWAAHGGL